jgi:hypothetical protein
MGPSERKKGEIGVRSFEHALTITPNRSISKLNFFFYMSLLLLSRGAKFGINHQVSRYFCVHEADNERSARIEHPEYPHRIFKGLGKEVIVACAAKARKQDAQYYRPSSQYNKNLVFRFCALMPNGFLIIAGIGFRGISASTLLHLTDRLGDNSGHLSTPRNSQV